MAFLHVELDPKLSGLKPQIEHASDSLEEIIGQTAALNSISWSLEDETKQAPGSRPRVRLRMKDRFSGELDTFFAPEEFEDSEHLWWRLNDFWGKVLQQGTKASLRRLDEILEGFGQEQDSV